MKRHEEMKTVFFDYLKDFKEYLSEYIRDSVTELKIGECIVKDRLELFDGVSRGKVTIKNQGRLSCYISTGAMGGYRLDPGEKQDFYLNNKVVITASGLTSIGFIKS